MQEEGLTNEGRHHLLFLHKHMTKEALQTAREVGVLLKKNCYNSQNYTYLFEELQFWGDYVFHTGILEVVKATEIYHILHYLSFQH